MKIYYLWCLWIAISIEILAVIFILIQIVKDFLWRSDNKQDIEIMQKKMDAFKNTIKFKQFILKKPGSIK